MDKLICECGFEFNKIKGLTIWDEMCTCPKCGNEYKIECKLKGDYQADWNAYLIKKEVENDGR